MEDVLFAGAVISNVRKHFDINCDSSHIAEAMYEKGKKDLFGFLKKNNASHYHRLMNFGLEKDIRYCLTVGEANVLPTYEEGKLLVK
jgi:2-phosphosulfolactate phosphatase